MYVYFLLQAEKAKVVQALMFISGVNTLLQSMFGTRLSTVVAGSYAFLIPNMSIIKAKRFQMIHNPQEVDSLHLYYYYYYCIVKNNNVLVCIDDKSYMFNFLVF